MATGHIRAVAFDVMDTIVYDPFREALRAATGLGLDELFSRRSPHAYPALERGEMSEDEYWSFYRDAGVDVDVEAFHATRRGGYQLLDGMAELLDELDGQVRRIGATNYPVWIRELEVTFLDDLLDEIVASCDVAARKPDRAFYDAVVEAAGVAHGEVAFVDDRDSNVVGAREAGLHAHLFTDAEALRAWLAELGLDV